MDTRLRKLEAGEYDAVILAAAGLNRLGKRESIRQVLPAKLMCPAAGQGALAVEIRKDDCGRAAGTSFFWMITRPASRPRANAPC